MYYKHENDEVWISIQMEAFRVNGPTEMYVHASISFASSSV